MRLKADKTLQKKRFMNFKTKQTTQDETQKKKTEKY